MENNNLEGVENTKTEPSERTVEPKTPDFTTPIISGGSGKHKKVGMPIKVLCYTAIFVALSAVTNIYTFYFGSGGALGVSLTYIPDFFAGALLGPLPGLLTGLLGDLIGCWIAPKGDINFIILLSSGLLGLIPGIVFKLFGKIKIKGAKHIAAIISLVLMLFICTTLNSFGLYVYYFKKMGRTFLAVLAMRVNQVLIWAINSVIIMFLLYPMDKIVKL